MVKFKLDNEIKSKAIGAVATLVTCLLTFLFASYFGSLATNARVDTIEAKLDRIISMICFIDNRACKITK